jgi:hypothetical protein
MKRDKPQKSQPAAPSAVEKKKAAAKPAQRVSKSVPVPPKGPAPTERSLPSERDLRLAAQTCATFEAAAEQLGGVDLEGLLAGSKKLAAAWERGRFLRQVRQIAEEGIVAEEADRFLLPPLAKGTLAAQLATDHALRDIWVSGQGEAKRKARAGLMKLAEAGDPRARGLYEQLLCEQRQSAGAVDWDNLTPTQLEAATGILRPQWDRWAKQSGCPRKTNGTHARYSLPAVIAWLRTHESTGSVKLEKGMDPLRAKKVEEKELDLAERRHHLLDRQQVVIGIVQRHRRLAEASKRIPDLLIELQGQGVEHMGQILEEFFRGLRAHQSEEFGELYLPEAAWEHLCAALNAAEGA